MRSYVKPVALVGTTMVALFMLLGSPQKTSEPPLSTSRTHELDPDKRGSSEGIAVRGAWVIEVVDSQGAVVHRREFHNALTDQGANYLSRLVAGVESTEWIEIRLVGGPCLDGGNQTSCRIVQPEFSCGPATVCFPDLQFAAADSLSLYGAATASADADIAAVQVYVTPSGGIERTFTSTLLEPRIPTQVGQEIRATVTISFSTATAN